MSVDRRERAARIADCSPAEEAREPHLSMRDMLEQRNESEESQEENADIDHVASRKRKKPVAHAARTVASNLTRVESAHFVVAAAVAFQNMNAMTYIMQTIAKRQSTSVMSKRSRRTLYCRAWNKMVAQRDDMLHRRSSQSLMVE